VAWHYLIGDGSTASQTIYGSQVQATLLKAAYGLGGQLGIGAGGFARDRVQHIMAIGNAVASQNGAAGARWLSRYLAKHTLHCIIGHRRSGEYGGHSSDVSVD
jgi:hypothetical protein